MTSSKEKYLKKLCLHFVMNHKKIYCQRILCHIATFSTSVEDDDGRKLNWLSLNLSAIICLPCPGTPSMATATFTSSSDSPSLVMMVTTMILIMTATAPSHHFPFLKHLNPWFQWQLPSIIGWSQQSSVVISFGRCEIPFIIIGNTIILVIFIIITIVTSSCLIPFSSSSIWPPSPHHNIIITIIISSS